MIKYARLYADLLQDHIAHENKLVFPVSSWLLPISEQTRLDEKFAAVIADHAAWDRSLALLEKLENK